MGRNVKEEKPSQTPLSKEEEHPTAAQLSKPRARPKSGTTPKPSSLNPAKLKKPIKPNGKEVEHSMPMKELSNTQIKNMLGHHGGKSPAMSHTQFEYPIDGSPSRGQAKSSAVIRAQEVRSNLEPQFPSFVKSLVRSHVASCFWMGLPSLFCKSHLPDKDITMTLEDESGRHYQLKYIAYKTGLSAGWRQFAASHNLIEGDVLVFQLIEPTKFKVYIIRSNDLTEVDGALGLLNLDNRTKQKDADKDTAETSTVACNDSNRKRAHSPPLVLHKDTAETSTAACNDSNRKCAHSPPLVLHKDTAETSTAACNDSNWKRAHSPPLVLHKDTAETSTASCNDSNRKRAHSPPLVIQKKKKASMQQAEQSENGSEEVDSEVSEDPKLPFIARHFEDIQSFDNFSILVNGSLVDSEFPKEVRKKYYKLCCSQNAFLHENFIEGMNHNLVIGAISETVNIADAIKACKLTTARDDFMSWEKCLIAFELLGMNVGFLRDRVCRLANFANDSDAAVEARMYKHSKIERSQAGIGIRTIETKLDELRDACDDFGAAIESLRSKAEAYTLRFQEEAASPW